MEPFFITAVVVAILAAVGLAAKADASDEPVAASPYKTTIFNHTTPDGSGRYRFALVQGRDRTWRAYIVSMPTYGIRRTDPQVTHRLLDKRSAQPYVCWDTPLHTEGDVRRVAEKWADLTQVYIRTGKTIDEQVCELRARA